METRTPKTHDNGPVSLQIGGGNIESGIFKDISWLSGNCFIQNEINPTGGTNYTLTGKSQILSMPYALNVKTADNIQTNATL